MRRSRSAIHGELKTVAYFVNNGMGGATAVPVNTTAGQAAPTSGLARLEGDHLAIGYAMQQSSSLMQAAQVIAPEVTMISFRYFDGTQWQLSWDSAYMQALPRAVECTLSVRTPDTSGSASRPDPLSPGATRLYRHVVAISTMAPPVPINELNTVGTTQ